MVRAVVSSPPELVAVKVYVTGVADRTRGIPLMPPVAESSVIPAGRGGFTAYVTTSPPELEGTMSAIAVCLVKMTAAEPYDRSVGDTGIGDTVLG